MLFQAIIIQVIFFAGLVYVLRKVLLASSFEETRRLQQLNEENANKAQELAAKIADAENEYRERMRHTDDEIQAMKAKAKKEIEELKDAIIVKGKAEGERIVTQALNARDEIRAEIEEGMHERVIEFSQKLIRHVFSDEELELVHEGLLANVINELDVTDDERLRGVVSDEEEMLTVKVKTPHRLKTGHKKDLETILSRKFGKPTVIEEEEDRGAIAGILITLGSFVIDGSLVGRLDKAAQSIT